MCVRERRARGREMGLWVEPFQESSQKVEEVRCPVLPDGRGDDLLVIKFVLMFLKVEAWIGNP